MNNLISFLENYTYNIKISPQTEIRRAMEEDGIGAVYLIDALNAAFFVRFENFNFKKYFLEEQELCFSWDKLFNKRRMIEQELTVEKLFDYMKENCKTV
jgi:hypothetical protein